MQSLDRGLAIMKYLSNRNSVSVSEIASTFNITKSTASRIMSTLANHDIASQNGVNKKYRLGIGTLMFSSQMLNENLVLETFRPVMRHLMEATGEMLHLCAWNGSQVYMLDQMRGKNHSGVRSAVLPGMAAPVYCSAAGKVLLAYRPEEEQRALLEQTDVVAYTDMTLTDREEILEELRTIREKGYALEREEMQGRVFSMAVPIFGSQEDIKYSLGLTSNKDFTQCQEKLEYYFSVLRMNAKKIQERTERM